MGKYSLEIELGLSATDANKTLRGNRFAHNAVRQKVKREVGLLVHGKTPEKPLTKFYLTFTRHSPGTLDFDNLVSSLKPVIDGLVIAGVIQDDNWDYIRSVGLDQVKSKEKKLVVRVEECE